MSSSTPFPSILVIIVTWNKKQYVLDLLASLQNLEYPASALEVIVVDNASEDGSAEAIAAQYPQATVLRNAENLGGTGGFNTGLQWAFAQPEGKYQYCWLLDNDVLVHRRALSELVAVLEQDDTIGVAGSTMMQLDYPWRINEMGAYFDRGRGQLVLNRHFETIPHWQGRPVQELLQTEGDLTQHLIHCNSAMDVDYVAAASLLIRAEIAKEAGIWRDFFLHFDDVEWCLRIYKDLRKRVVVSAKSLIWHLSAAAKVPTWVLYYDNRNVLVTLEHHGAGPEVVRGTIRYIYKKAVYYALLGKWDLSRLHRAAVEDYQAGVLGKKAIRLDATYHGVKDLAPVFHDPAHQRLLVAWPVNLQASGAQEALVKAMLDRPEMRVEMLLDPLNPKPQWPRAQVRVPPRNPLRRLWFYWKLRGRYDLVVQSDYQAMIPLAWLGAKLLYLNDEGFSLREKPRLNQVFTALGWWLRG